MTHGLESNENAEGRARLLHGLDAAGVYGIWQKALERRHADPEGAITSARGLLEKVCRLVLDEKGIAYSEALDLPVLMKMTVEQLNFAPTGASEMTFKRMLSSAAAVVEGLCSLRNKIGDARGEGEGSTKPSARHAQVAANIAGAAAIFVVETWEARVEEEFFEVIDDSKGS
jgi:abortive infection Abi-like protein